LGQRERASDDAQPSTIPEWPVSLGNFDEASKHVYAGQDRRARKASARTL